MTPQDVADQIAAQVLDGFNEATWDDLRQLCVRPEEWWIMGADARPYVIRLWANGHVGGVTVRVRVDTNGWTWTEPALGVRLLELDPDH